MTSSPARTSSLPAASLPGAWLGAARAAGARGDLAGEGARLLGAWAAPHRAYHTPTHLAEVLGRLGELAADVPPAVGLAAWFHDAVYDPARADSEAASAALAARVLGGLGVPAAAVAEVARLVRLTAGHDPGPGDRDGGLLCDADLAVLAAGPARYAAYAEGVRREYAHLSDAAFGAGRATVLRGLLARPALFRTAYGARHWEDPARANLAAELGRLAGPGLSPASGA